MVVMRKADKMVVVWTEFGKGLYEDADFTEAPDLLGVVTEPLPILVDGEWRPSETETRVIFGRCTPDGYMTHMCYGSDYASLPGLLEHARVNDYFYFDAGGNGRPVRTSYANMKKAMVELGLVQDE